MNLSKHWAATLDDYVIDLAWSPDGKLLAAASAAGGVTLYDAATGAVRHKLTGHDNGANCLAWSPVERTVPGEPSSPARPEDSPYLLATGGQDGKVKLWNPIDGSPLHEISLGSAWVEHLTWQPVQRTDPAGKDPSSVFRPLSSDLLFAAAGKKLVALSTDGTVANTFKDAPKSITALCFSLSSVLGSPSSVLGSPSSVLAAAYFGGVCVWDAAAFIAHKEFPYGNAIHALIWSPDGRWLVAGCQDNAVHLWAPAEDLELHMSGYETKLKELSFSHDSKWLATGGGKDACIWDCTGAGPEGREPLLLPHTNRVCAVAFQQQHGLLATGATDGEFCLWAPSRKNPLVAEVKMPSAATKFAWRADDSLFAVGTEKGMLYVFKIEA